MTKSTGFKNRFGSMLQFGKEVHFIRYGTHEVIKDQNPLLTMQFISKILRQPTQRCYHALSKYIESQAESQVQNSSQELKPSQRVTVENVSRLELDQLTSQSILINRAEWSLQQRVAHFNHSNAGRLLTRSQLRNIFREHGIKKKAVIRRLSSARSLDYQRREAQQFFTHFTQAEQRRSEIVMLDECVFSSKSYQLSAWTQKGQNVVLDKRFKNTTCIAVVAAISSQRGLIGYHLKPKSIKSVDFVKFIKTIREKMGASRYTLLLDQCSVHRANVSKTAMLGIDVLFNVAYSPWYNGIEIYWAQAKQYFRKALIRKMLDSTELNLSELVRWSLDQVAEARVKDCAEHALKRIRLDKSKV